MFHSPTHAIRPFFGGIITALALALVPASAFAHVKWFVDEGADIEPYSLTESWVVIWLAACALIIVAAFIIEKKWPSKKTTRKHWNKNLLRFFQISVGIWLVLSAVTGFNIAPVFTMENTYAEIIRVCLFVAGILFMVGLTPMIASLLLGGAYVAAGFLYGWNDMVEHIHVLAIALAYAIVTSSPSQFISRYAYATLPLLRIGVGTSLIILAFHEKLLHPDLGYAFLLSHNWNFMELLGFNWFDDRLFILSVGMTELLIGLLYVLGLVIRLNTAAFAVVVTTTAILLGPHEVLGHLPIIACVVVLAIYGPGRYTITALLRKRGRRGRANSGSSSRAYEDDSDDE